MINWDEILEGGCEDIAELVKKHAEGITGRYGETDGDKKKKGVDISLKLVLTEDENDADSVIVKSRISFATLRVKEEKTRTFTSQQKLPE